MTSIDFRFLIWKFNDYNDANFDHLKLAEEFVELADNIIKYDNKLMIHADVISEVFDDNVLPLGNVREHYPDLVDLHSVILSSWTKINGNINYFDDNEEVEIVTDPVLLSEEYTYNLNISLKKSFRFFLNFQGKVFLLSSEIVSKDIDNIVISFEENEKVVELFKAEAKQLVLLQGSNRIFEPNPKHDEHRPHPNHRGDEVSILSADGELAQELLIFAQSDNSGSRKLYNYDNVNSTYVAFLPHRIEEKRYHGFDVEQKDVPQIVQNKLR